MTRPARARYTPAPMAANPDSMDVPAVVPTADAQAIQRLNYAHEAMIDMIIMRPGITLHEMGETLGYTVPWLSRIQSSDAFKARLAERAAQYADPLVKDAVQSRLQGILNRGAEVLEEKLAKPADKIPDVLALRSVEVAARALGYGVRPETLLSQMNAEQQLDQLGQNLINLLRRKRIEADQQTTELNSIVAEVPARGNS